MLRLWAFKLGIATVCLLSVEALGSAQAQVAHAVEWIDGHVMDLGGLPGRTTTEATAINDGGQVVGYSYIGSGSNNTSATEWSGGQVTYLGQGIPLAVNDMGQAAGYTGIDGHFYATEYSGGQTLILPSLPGSTDNLAHSINAAGDVVGWSIISCCSPQVIDAVEWIDGHVINLGALWGSTYSFALGINDAGQVVGESCTVNGATCDAVEWSGGQVINLGGLPGFTGSAAYAINDAGQVVGSQQRHRNRHCDRMEWRPSHQARRPARQHRVCGRSHQQRRQCGRMERRRQHAICDRMEWRPGHRPSQSSGCYI